MKSFIKKEKAFIMIIFSLILLSLFFHLINFNKFILYPLSLCANIVLILIIKLIIEKFKITFSKKEKIFLTIEIICIYLFYFYSIINRVFIYYWDYSCYYNIQLDLIQAFEQGFFSGLKQFIGSTWSGEYGSFLNFFPQTIFQLTNKSINSYLLSCVLTYIPYITISYSIVIKRVIHKFKIKEPTFFYLSLLLLILMPVIHVSLIYGQPDVFGLCFIFLIISLVIDYDFKKIDIDRLLLLGILTYFLTICRRWYLYWIISFYICYGIMVLINNPKEIKTIIKNALKFIIVMTVVYVLTLYPFIKNTLFSNYATSYEFYSNGGFFTEVSYQIKHLGLLLVIIILGGLIVGLKEKKYRNNTIVMFITSILIILLFTKIQNMGLHHSILLVPTYLYCIIMMLLCAFNNKKIFSRIIITMIITILLVNTISNYNHIHNKLFGDISLKVEEEKNYNELKQVVKWLEKKLNNKDRAYMITHNNMFNPDKLRNFYTPNSIVHEYLPYGSAIIGVHKFPIELFEARYIITTTPFDNTSIEYKYNDVLKELIEEEVFKEIKSFNMKENYKILIYERVKPVTEEEKEKYLETLKEESKTYKDLYENIIKDYK